MPRPSARSRRRDRVFFTALENGHHITKACVAAGYARASVYEWRRSDPEFESEWQISSQMAADLLEEEADRRGRHGTDVPVFYRGAEVGKKRRYSDRALLARLGALKPELYREKKPPPDDQSERPQFRVVEADYDSLYLRLFAEGTLSAEHLPERLQHRLASEACTVSDTDED